MRRLKDNLMALAIRSITPLVMALAAVLLFAPAIYAQSDGIVDVTGEADPQAQAAGHSAPSLPFWSQTAGQADVALQGYYLSGSGQPLISTSGAAINFKEFLPGIGLLHANVEGYGGNGFHTGTMFLGLEQAPLFGWHWDFVGGDSQFSSNLVTTSFTNLYTPDISERGFRVSMKRKDRSYKFFIGDDTLLGGPRIPYRLPMPQLVIGAAMQQTIGARWQIGVRFLHTDTNPSALVNYSNFFLPGHEFEKSSSLAFQSSYEFSKHLRLNGELSYGTATSFTPAAVAQEPVSFFVGPSWESDKFTLRGNYVFQSTTYQPLLGYFAGDRRGPFAEAHYRITPKIDLYGSASAYSNNLEHNPLLPTFHSSGVSGGASFVLPWKLNASASLSTLHLTTLNPSQPLSPSENRQISLSMSRTLARHNLRVSYIDMNLNSNLLPQTQRFTDIGDTFTWKRLVLGGGVRIQGSQSTQTQNSLFFRGSIQANFRRFSAYANIEKGNDLVNRSVFSTNAYSTTVLGFNSPLRGGWNLQLEAFRNNLNTALNPENVFLFPTAGLGATQLPGFSQWSGYFRMGKTFRWGNRELASSGGIDQYTAARLPLVGSVQGVVMEQSLGGSQPAANVVVSLDHDRTAISDATGRYTFSEVPEGSHEVGLDLEQLAANYEPGPEASGRVTVEPRALVRTDFNVVRLTSLAGKVVAPTGSQIADVVIRLEGSSRYTTPDDEGNFGFYNLREGDYKVAFDQQTLPDELMLTTPGRIEVMASSENTASPAVEFRLELKPVAEKPVRQILRQQIHVASSPKPAVRPAPASGRKQTQTSGSVRDGDATGTHAGSSGGGGGGGGGGS